MSKQAKRGRNGKFKPGVSGNPRGRPRKDARKDAADELRVDDWRSMVTGLGTEDDKRTTVGFNSLIVDDVLAANLWRGDDIAARVIEEPPGDMLREGFELVIQPDPDEDKPKTKGPAPVSLETPKVDRLDADDERKAISKDTMAFWDDMQSTEKFERALQYERAYGGGALLIGAIDNAGGMEKPLNVENTREVRFITVLEKRELTPERWYTDPFSPKFGEPELWRITPTAPGGSTITNKVVHESRLLIFGGIRVSRHLHGTSDGFGDSVLTRAYSVLRDFQAAWGGAGSIVQDFSIAVHKIVGLAELVAANNGDAIKERLKAIHLSRSILHTTVIDSEEEFERQTTSIMGLPDLLNMFGTRLSAAFGFPVTRLMGTSAKGLNATGEGDDNNYDDRIADRQRKLKPKIEYLLRIFMAAAGHKEPLEWGIQYRSLDQESPTETATARKTIAEADAIYIDRGVLSAEEIAVSRFSGDEFSYETVIDFEDRSSVDTMEPEPEPEIDPVTGEPIAAPAPIDPNAQPGSTPMPGAVEVQKTAMNGAQVTSMIDVIARAGSKEISRESAKEILVVAFQVEPDQAERLLGPANFEPPKPEPPVIMPGGPPKPGGFPPKPGDKPPIGKQIKEAINDE